MINREWGTISFPSSLINHVWSHDQQNVSDTALLLCKAVSSIISHPMTNREWVTLFYFFARQSHQLSHPMTNSEWVSLLYFFATHAVSSIMSHPMTNSQWVTLLYFFAMQPLMTNSMWVTISLPGSLINHVWSHGQQYVSNFFFARQSYQSWHIPWPTVCEGHNFTSFPYNLINHASPMTNRMWVCLIFAGSLINHIPHNQ